MTLDFYLCYVNAKNLFNWIEKNNLCEENFFFSKRKWKKGIDKKPNFFSDTELLLVYQDILLLKVADDAQASFLAKTYQLHHQEICQKIFSEKKNIILVTNEEWIGKRSIKGGDFVLFKDEETIQKNLLKWLEKINV